MKKSYRLITGVVAGVLAVGLMGAGQAADASAPAKACQNQAATPHYDIAKRTEKATVDGKMDDGCGKRSQPYRVISIFLGTQRKHP